MPAAKVWLGGEGPTELGGLAGHPSFRDPTDHGVLQTLVLLLQPDAAIHGATVWSKIHKYASGAALTSRAKNEALESLAVRRLCLMAEEAGADVVVFARDRDAFDERDQQIADGIDAARAGGSGVRVGGGVAVRAIEAWALLVLGDPNAEQHRDPKSVLDAKHGSTRAHQCDVLAAENALARVPKGTHFDAWLVSVRAALADR